MVGFSAKTAATIFERDGGRCVRCGGRGAERHHRRRRRINNDGLAHSPANGVLFCGWGNHTGCHGWVHSHPEEAREAGYIVPPWASPLDVRVRHYSRGWIRLTEDGGWYTADWRIDERALDRE